MEPMNKQEIQAYLIKNKLFPADADFKTVDILEENPSSEGYVNKLFQVIDQNTGKSVVVKQVMPYMLSVARATGEMHTFSMDRMKTEIRAMVFMNTLCHGIVPEIYRADYKNGIFVMEDLCDLGLLRFDLADGITYPNVGKELGAYLAGLYFYTSAAMLGENEKDLLTLYFLSKETFTINSFLNQECALINLEKPMEPEVLPIRERIVNNPVILAELKKLSDKFLTAKECLAHNDLHTSNVMIDATNLKLIDTEFAGYTAAFMDPGRLISSFIVNYISWLGTPDIPMEKRMAMQAYDIQMIKDFCNAYERTLMKLWHINDIDGEPNGKFEIILRESIEYAMACVALRVQSSMAQSCEIKRITNHDDLVLVQTRALQMAEYVLQNAADFRNVDQFCEFLWCCCGVEIQ